MEKAACGGMGGRPVITYRVYFFDGRSQIRTCSEIVAASDAEAREWAADMAEGPRVEIWDRGRFVGAIECCEPLEALAG